MDTVQIASWALAVSFLSMIVSACTFVLQLRRWFDEGVKLTISIMAEAKKFGVGTVDKNTYVSVTVTNRGDAPTTLTHLLVYTYPNKVAIYTPRRLLRFLKQPSPKTWIIPQPTPGTLPHLLEPGTYWIGLAVHTAELKTAITTGCAYIGIISSHSDRIFFKRIRPSKMPGDAETMSS
jgi:hypothetical protein